MLNLIIASFMTLTLAIIFLFTYIDWKTPRKKLSSPLISFIVPCYNDGDTIEETIKSIYDSCNNFELIIVNDCSKDSSMEKLEKLKNIYEFQLICNQINIGKSESINRVSDLAKGEIIFIVDADCILNKQGIEDMLARFDYRKDLGAVSCPYRAKNKGFWALMQSLEYNMLSLIQSSHNLYSTLSLWGGCLAVRREAFFKAGKLSKTAIIEDMDLALKLNRNKWKVEQSFYFMYTDATNSFKSWWRQKVRWSSGSMQCMIKYYDIYLKNPIYIFFFLFYWAMLIIFLFSLSKSFLFISNIYNFYTLMHDTGMTLLDILLSLKVTYGLQLLHGLMIKTAFILFSVPYAVMLMKSWKQAYKIVYIIPFSLIYLPLFSIVSAYGFFVGIKRYKSLERGERAW